MNGLVVAHFQGELAREVSLGDVELDAVNISALILAQSVDIQSALAGVVSVAQPLSSDVGASDANIGSVSTITVTKYSTAYYHSLPGWIACQLVGVLGASEHKL